MAGAGVLMTAYVIWANRPAEARLDLARSALAEAGFGEAEVRRGQSPTNMSRCEVGQMQHRGYAYTWSSGEARGLFCLRADGRPNRVIVDKAA